MKINGSCHCGFITVEGEADPERVSICHCTDCQTRTGSAFGVIVPIPGNTFKMKGRPTTYLKTTAESGNPRVQASCTLRVGILAQRDQLAPKRQNWFRSARSWVTSMDGIHKNQKQA